MMYEKLKEYGIYISLGLIGIGGIIYFFNSILNQKKGEGFQKTIQISMIDGMKLKDEKRSKNKTILELIEELDGKTFGTRTVYGKKLFLINQDGLLINQDGKLTQFLTIQQSKRLLTSGNGSPQNDSEELKEGKGKLKMFLVPLVNSNLISTSNLNGILELKKDQVSEINKDGTLRNILLSLEGGENGSVKNIKDLTDFSRGYIGEGYFGLGLFDSEEEATDFRNTYFSQASVIQITQNGKYAIFFEVVGKGDGGSSLDKTDINKLKCDNITKESKFELEKKIREVKELLKKEKELLDKKTQNETEINEKTQEIERLRTEIQEKINKIKEKDTDIRNKTNEINQKDRDLNQCSTDKQRIETTKTNELNTLRTQKENEIRSLRDQKDSEIRNITETKDREINNLRTTKETEIRNITETKNREIETIRNQKDTEIRNKDTIITQKTQEIQQKTNELNEKNKIVEKLNSSGAIFYVCVNNFKKEQKNSYSYSGILKGEFEDNEICERLKKISIDYTSSTHTSYLGNFEFYDGIKCKVEYSGDNEVTFGCKINGDGALKNIDYIIHNYNGEGGFNVQPGNHGFRRYYGNRGFDMHYSTGRGNFEKFFKELYEDKGLTTTQHLRKFFSKIKYIFGNIHKQINSISLENPKGTFDGGVFGISRKKPITIQKCGGFETNFFYNGNGYYGTGDFQGKLCKEDGTIVDIYQNLNHGCRRDQFGTECNGGFVGSTVKNENSYDGPIREGIVLINKRYDFFIGNSKESILRIYGYYDI